MGISAVAEITKQELLDLIDVYVRQKAQHSLLEASRAATTRTDRGPARREVRALDEATDYRAAIKSVVDALPI